MSDTTKSLQDELKESANRIWLAGLGALSAAGEEGGKLFDRLVERGREYEGKGREEARKQYEGAKSSAEDLWNTWSEKLDEAVTKALHRMGVPTRDEIRNLTRRVEELNAKVELLRPRVTPAGASSPYGEIIPQSSPTAAPEGTEEGPVVLTSTGEVHDPTKVTA